MRPACRLCDAFHLFLFDELHLSWYAGTDSDPDDMGDLKLQPIPPAPLHRLPQSSAAGLARRVSAPVQPSRSSPPRRPFNHWAVAQVRSIYMNMEYDGPALETLNIAVLQEDAHERNLFGQM